ncbi:MAG: 16S rRNA (guanine(527)-N(7))-methyltransferase RsmG [Lachnospiraceae bacterium]|nr:16S rRNA (guanine(527)-N(7))-methyltransferase RsmG [Lachnospiraceae bacterium]
MNQIKEAFLPLGVELSDHQTEQFYRYYEMLVETNKVMNLTAITEFPDVLVKHFVDSGALMKVMDLKNCKKLIDIGTGAGFPGIPLKILYPHLQVTLLDSLNKRINFLRQVVNELGLENVELLHGRAEDYARRKEYRECYDICVSRAVANLSTLSEYCIPYIKKNGLFVPYKSGKIAEELEQAGYAIKELGCVLEKSEEMCLPGTEIERMFVFIKKNRSTPGKYPRKAGLPGKEPLVSVKKQ